MIFSAIFLIFFIVISLNLNSLSSLDLEINKIAFPERYVPFFEFVSLFGDFFVILPISIALIFILIRKKEKGKVIIFSLFMIFLFALKIILKEFFARERPENMLIPEKGFSYPSGHSLYASFLYISALILFWPYLSKRDKVMFASISSIIIILVGLSRIYLRVHWLTDVISGYIIGIFSSFLMKFFIDRYGERIKF